MLNLDNAGRGVDRVAGFCPNREGNTNDVAFTIRDRNVASLATSVAFPESFPSDFSILTTFRAESRSKSMLFTMYSAAGSEVLSLKVGRRLKLYYQGINSRSKYVVKFGARLADGE